MKFLIGRTDGLVRSAHSEPMRFSIAGRYAIDVPDGFLVDAPTDSVPDLIDEKVRAFKTQCGGAGLPFAVFDELLAIPNVDVALSDKYIIGPDKRTGLLPGGYLTTNIMFIPVDWSQVYLHWYGFILYSDPGPQPPDPTPESPPPPKLLYNYDAEAANFVGFNSLDFEVRILGVETTATGPVGPVATSFDVVSAAQFPAAPFSIIVDDELMQVTSVVSNTLTVTRADPVDHTVTPVVSLLLASPISDVKQDIAEPGDTKVPSGNIRLRFKNVSPKIKHLSDWILLHDAVV